MAIEPLLIICPNCTTANRVPRDKIAANGKCGRCSGPLFNGHPVTLGATNFDAHAIRSDIPLLVDFWASWCGPCRKANPHVVEMYNKYKSKGFDVFSVSLDKQDGKQNWINAIKQDGLIWSNHVSDLQWWQSAPAGVYGVQSIPKTFLIGKDGKIVAVNPRNNLEEEILKAL